MFNMNYNQAKYLERLRWMSEERFEAETQTDAYKAISSDPSVKKEFREMTGNRIADTLKREKLLEALYSSPEALDWLAKIQAYRALRCEQAWVSIAMRDEGKGGNSSVYYQDLDKERRPKHNEALEAFCKLVEKATPYGTRDNRPPADGRTFMPRGKYDLYDGPLMNPKDEPNGYGEPYERLAMTNAMFQMLKLIELTPRSDWDKPRENILNKLKLSLDTKVPSITELQDNLVRMTRGWGMDAPPDVDEFSTDLFDERDNKYRNPKKRGFDNWDDR